MTVTLRPYQADLEQAIYAEWQHARNVLAVLPTGGGKTCIFSKILADTRGPSVAVAHRQELVSQISLALARNEVRHRIIAPDNVRGSIEALHMIELGRRWVDQQAPCGVAGVDTLLRMTGAHFDAWRNGVQRWVMDECFPAGTLIEGQPIETIRVGQLVTAFNEASGEFERRRVVRLFRNQTPDYMVRVLSAHHVLECTPSHPIYTKRGWVNAAELRHDDELLHVRDGSFTESRSDVVIRENGPGLLFESMLHPLPRSGVVDHDDENQSRVCLRADARAQPNAQPQEPSEDGRDPCGDGPRTKVTRRKRQASDCAGDPFAPDVRGLGVCVSMCGEHRVSLRDQSVPAALQNRFGESNVETRHRGGRELARSAEEKAAGCEEGRVIEWARVDDIALLQRGNTDAAREGREDGYVYNFEVEGLHTYIAGGVVVHNCHHVLRDNKWGRGCELFPNAYGLGVTATPVRADGKGLGRHADGLMDSMILGPSMRDLIDAGYLTDYRIFAPKSDLDLSAVKVGESGDYVAAQLRAAVHKSHITGDVVDHYLRLAPGKLGVTFAVDIEAATEIAAAFRARGVPAEVVSSKTPDSQRVAILRRFRRREVLQLVNVDLFGEGFDLPAIEVVIMARPTQSYALFCQQFGRALRLLEGKLVALIIDHVGNVFRHGLPDAARSWSLDRREKRARGANDAMPTTVCSRTEPEVCAQTYERFHPCCPFCGFAPEPVGRSAPEQVDGDLQELDAAVLAAMRGEADRVMGAPRIPAGVPAQAVRHNHMERLRAQVTLRHVMQMWGGWREALGESLSMAQRRFYLTFGVDVMTAQTLGAREAGELMARLDAAMLGHVVPVRTDGIADSQRWMDS